MLAKVFSGAVYGVDTYKVEIEVNASRRSTAIVGFPETAVKEKRTAGRESSSPQAAAVHFL